MERSKALTLLGLDDMASLDEVTDALDQAVFKVRDHFLRAAIVPRLAESRVDKCVQLSDVAQSLGVAVLGNPVAIPELVSPEPELEAVILGQVENLRRCRNAMASTLDPDSVAQLGHLMANIQIDYMRSFMSLTSGFEGDEPQQPVAAREEADWMALLAAVRAWKRSPGQATLLQDLVAKDRARMGAMLNATRPEPS
jgi:hypothetical protein